MFFYFPTSNVPYFGDGRRRTIWGLQRVSTTIIGKGTVCYEITHSLAGLLALGMLPLSVVTAFALHESQYCSEVGQFARQLMQSSKHKVCFVAALFPCNYVSKVGR